MTDAVRTDLARSGTLRASINLGNAVLAQGTPQDPSGVTVDLARALAARLDVPLELVCFDAARKSLEAMTTDAADVCFLAIDPARAAEIAFTDAYVLIEGVYVVPEDSALGTPADVDAEGVRIGVKQGSAYDLHLSRALRAATVVRGDEGVDVFVADGLEAGAGIREPVTAWVADHPGHRVIAEAFMQIRQAMATTRDRSPETVAYLRAFIEEHKANGFIRASLDRAGQTAAVAPPASG